MTSVFDVPESEPPFLRRLRKMNVKPEPGLKFATYTPVVELYGVVVEKREMLDEDGNERIPTTAMLVDFEAQAEVGYPGAGSVSGGSLQGQASFVIDGIHALKAVHGTKKIRITISLED
jgi:hypothetical protein